MRTGKLVPLSVLLVLCLSATALTACGGDDDDSGNGTTEAPAATTEADEATADGGNAPAPSGDAVRSAKVEIIDFAYDPDPVTVEEGGKVTWINRDSDPHTATADDDSFDTGTLAEGKLKSESFQEPGSYPYICTIHPDMKGTVEVVTAG